MAVQAAERIKYSNDYIFGSAVAVPRYDEPVEVPAEAPKSQTREQSLPRTRQNAAAAKKQQGVSLFAIFGSVLIAALMIFIVLAQISYNEVAG